MLTLERAAGRLLRVVADATNDRRDAQLRGVQQKNSKAFCLAEAPDEEAAIAVHREAHGLGADLIYPVIKGP